MPRKEARSRDIPTFETTLAEIQCPTRTVWGTFRPWSASSSRMLPGTIHSARQSASTVSSSRTLRNEREAPGRSRWAPPQYGTCHRRRKCRQRGSSVVGTVRVHTRPPDCNRCQSLTDRRSSQPSGHLGVGLPQERWDCYDRRARPRPRRAQPPAGASYLVITLAPSGLRPLQKRRRDAHRRLVNRSCLAAVNLGIFIHEPATFLGESRTKSRGTRAVHHRAVSTICVPARPTP
jgi:hypothetical protein